MRILTVHGAKGLQAPIVFLPDTLQAPNQMPRLLWTEAGLPLWTPRRTLDAPAAAVARQAAQHAAATFLIGDDISDIATEIRLAALAVVGLAEELNGDGQDLSNWLNKISGKVRGVGERLSLIDIEATKRKLDEVLGR